MGRYCRGCVFFTVMLRDFQTDLSDLQISANVHRKSDLSNRSFRSSNVAFSSFTGGDETNLWFIQIKREIEVRERWVGGFKEK
ncbi:hypothetical protein L1987_49668 [Smallanthus sonchifolius]|uniref:Uncharacterized protein n=1 Tax=Smallanthus sonchifolius TaxID=185202 RepID=A0ACB9FWC6_9ASTR|nr:hypothetical protein L1987_49668 [Smallanthus sonchifolius]